MTSKTREMILRANGLFLLTAGVSGIVNLDIPGIFFGVGAEAKLLNGAPYAGLGFLEAHGLAAIMGALLWDAAPQRKWHATGAAVHLLLGTCNLVLWQGFVVSDTLAMGYVATSFHWLFAALQVSAWLAAPAAESSQFGSTVTVPFRSQS